MIESFITNVAWILVFPMSLIVLHFIVLIIGGVLTKASITITSDAMLWWLVFAFCWGWILR